MTSSLRALRLLTMVVWVGGLVFFAFVLAPVAFHVLPTTHEAGLVVAGSLLILHRIGLVCGAVFLTATSIQLPAFQPRARKLVLLELGLVLLMMIATFFLQASIIPNMERDRIAAGGDVDAAPINNPARLDFERLHPISEKVEGAALFLGLGVVVLMAVGDSR